MPAARERYFRHGDYRIDHLTHISRRHRVVYLEVPKTGCTVVKRVLQHSERAEAPAPVGVSVHRRDVSPLAAPLRDGFDLDELFGPTSTWLTFTFVRNPYSRALSAYLEKIAGPPKPGQRDVRTANLGFEAGEEISFAAFLERVADQRPGRMDVHWAPQTRLASFGRIAHGFVGRFETFETDLRRVMGLSGITAPESLLVTRTGHTTNARRRLAEFYADERCAALVRKIYARDFERLGYGRDVRFA